MVFSLRFESESRFLEGQTGYHVCFGRFPAISAPCWQLLPPGGGLPAAVRLQIRQRHTGEGTLDCVVFQTGASRVSYRWMPPWA